MHGKSAQFTDEKAMAQNGEVICLRSHGKVVKELVPALWTGCPLPMGSEAFVCACLGGKMEERGSGETDRLHEVNASSISSFMC